MLIVTHVFRMRATEMQRRNSDSSIASGQSMPPFQRSNSSISDTSVKSGLKVR